ncbi:hypothetical protein K0M31_015947 [Melipona bicolor]|uniref:Uncharacterized protein n=1 Tax=Melipona bicolor TaxID=60889 RepID=A0AA40KSZ5_9HYME|nr:hypothetical protein K0M31_015947 [Melipona bicolor]
MAAALVFRVKGTKPSGSRARSTPSTVPADRRGFRRVRFYRLGMTDVSANFPSLPFLSARLKIEFGESHRPIWRRETRGRKQARLERNGALGNKTGLLCASVVFFTRGIAARRTAGTKTRATTAVHSPPLRRRRQRFRLPRFEKISFRGSRPLPGTPWTVAASENRENREAKGQGGSSRRWVEQERPSNPTVSPASYCEPASVASNNASVTASLSLFLV